MRSYSTPPAATNPAIGASALSSSTDGVSNTAVGFQALQYDTTGVVNAAIGLNALEFNTTGSYNTATGVLALNSTIRPSSFTWMTYVSLPAQKYADAYGITIANVHTHRSNGKPRHWRSDTD